SDTLSNDGGAANGSSAPVAERGVARISSTQLPRWSDQLSSSAGWLRWTLTLCWSGSGAYDWTAKTTEALSRDPLKVAGAVILPSLSNVAGSWTSTRYNWFSTP